MANLITDPKAFNTGAWSKAGQTATDNAVAGPDGTTTGCSNDVTTPGGCHCSQIVAVTASTSYAFEFWAKRGTGTDVAKAVYDLTHSSDLYGPTSYYSSINSSTWAKVSVPFITPSGCVSLNVYTNRDGGGTGTYFTWYAYMDVASAIPTNMYAPTVSGSTPVGSLLTATSGGWWNDAGGSGYTYQWTRAGSNIGGATSSTYTTVTADATHVIGVNVAASNANGASAATASSNTITVDADPAGAAGFRFGFR